MFYTCLLLGKRGILSKIWIAAHWEKKLTKAHIFECNLETAIQSIMKPKVVIALRTSGHLLLGVVRIYHRKAKYLLADCNEALLNMKITFRPGALDLTENNQEASYNAITLPEEFPDFDMQLPDLNLIDVADHFTLNQSRVEEITIREELIRHDSFDDLDIFRHGSTSDIPFEVSTNSVLPEQSSALLPGDSRDLFADDFFGDEGAATDFFDDNQQFIESYALNTNKDLNQDVMLPPEDQPPEAYVDETQDSPMEDVPVANTTTLVSDEEIAFVLEPVDVSVIKKKKRTKKKRKLMVDSIKEIPSRRMQEQLQDTSDIVTTLDFAPQTHHLMELKLMGGVHWLLSHPSQPIISAELLQLFTSINRNMQKEPVKPTNKTPQHEQETELPQLEEAKLTEVSSSITEEPLDTALDLNDYNQPTSDMDSSVHEEHVDHLLGNSPGCLHEEPTSSGQNNDEQQWNKRTQNLLNGLRKLNQSGVSTFSFQNLCKNNKRKQVSTKFYSFLVLKKQSAIKMTQSAPYDNITVIPGPRFHTL
ncbi:double-strand-break repair protein rad21-like protein 1 isoform X2 [Hyla sarda]|uniref:double-strand-break repair protein rad21-like protein 1 isoform X2 n=1 Tax=Hyla sarda TaxID=327740 RepID=UPI0024C43764|nr:double-strand-break repair protein rad21-like protein 1 isoform X2 [Hyla sarda]